MKHLGVTVRPETNRSPPFLRHLLTSPDVVEARAIDWNRGASETSTHLYGISGDAETFASLARETAGVASVTLAGTDELVSYALLEIRDESVPIFGGAATAIDRTGLVVRRPLVYRNDRIFGHVIGDPAVLQAALDELPDPVSVQIDEIREFPGPGLDPTTTLSERQREALETALKMGYYDTPRGVTHEDIAAELDCAPNTASEHLQKGEAKLVRAGLEGLPSSP